MLACATSATGATFAVKVTDGPVRIVYSTVQPDPGVAMSDPAYSSTATVDTDGAAKVSVSGLGERTRYWWRVEDNGAEDTTRTGTFLTPPPAGTPASFVFAASGDAGLGGACAFHGFGGD